jgi:hypothetical protein
MIKDNMSNPKFDEISNCIIFVSSGTKDYTIIYLILQNIWQQV